MGSEYPGEMGPLEAGALREVIPSSSSLLLSSLELSDTQVCEPKIRALLGTASHFCEVVVLKPGGDGAAGGWGTPRGCTLNPIP